MKLFRRTKPFDPSSLTAAVPAGRRCYAVGDVHGRVDLLRRMLDDIRRDAAARGDAQTFLVFLGDYIDRGPCSREVIEVLATENLSWAKPVYLKGNHEEVFSQVLQGDVGILRQWLEIGGLETCESYGLSRAAWAENNPERFHERLLRLVPANHIAFLDNLYDSFSLGDYLFVHAGVRPTVPLEEQNPLDLRWIREEFLLATSDFGRLVVHGHTISAEPELRANRIGIDTGAYRTNRLTALALEGRERRFLTASVPVELASSASKA